MIEAGLGEGMRSGSFTPFRMTTFWVMKGSGEQLLGLRDGNFSDREGFSMTTSRVMKVERVLLQSGMVVRRWGLRVWLGVCLAGAAVSLQGQSSTPVPSSQQDNPFPGEPQKAPEKPAGQQTSKPGSDSKAAPGSAKPESDNPFPGEDSNAPIIPVDQGSGSGQGTGPGSNSGYAPAQRDGGTDSANSTRSGNDPNGDPVRSPDLQDATGSDGFSSSRTGLSGLPAEDDTDAVPGQSAKHKSRQEFLKEDLDTGQFYAEKKNWKASQSRFADAFSLDKESTDAIWGLAEAERHLQLYKEAVEHYELFLSYDPEGPHSRAARKALDQIKDQAKAQAKTPDEAKP